MGGPPWPPLLPGSASSLRGGHGVTELVLTSRYREETAFASFAFNVSLSRADSFTQSSQSTAKLAALGWFLRRTAHTGVPLNRYRTFVASHYSAVPSNSLSFLRQLRLSINSVPSLRMTRYSL